MKNAQRVLWSRKIYYYTTQVYLSISVPDYFCVGMDEQRIIAIRTRNPLQKVGKLEQVNSFWLPYMNVYIQREYKLTPHASVLNFTKGEHRNDQGEQFMQKGGAFCIREITQKFASATCQELSPLSKSRSSAAVMCGKTWLCLLILWTCRTPPEQRRVWLLLSAVSLAVVPSWSRGR